MHKILSIEYTLNRDIADLVSLEGSTLKDDNCAQTQSFFEQLPNVEDNFFSLHH